MKKKRMSYHDCISYDTCPRSKADRAGDSDVSEEEIIAIAGA